MLMEKAIRKIEEIFGLPGLTAGKRYTNEGEKDKRKSSFYLDSYWISQVGHWRFEYTHEMLTVGILKTSIWQKGILLVPPIREPLDREYCGTLPPKPIDLDDWEDEVAKSLQSINLFPSRAIGFSETGGRIWLRFGTTVVHGELAMDYGAATVIPSDKDSYHNLMDAWLLTIHHLVDLYDNDEICEYINRR